MPGFFAVGSIVRCVFMSRIMCELYERKPAALLYLRREHKTDFFFCHFWCKMDDALNILYSIAVSVSIAQPAVDEGSGAGPDKCHKAVIGIPCSQHGVEFLAWRSHPQMIQLFIPVGFKR